MVATRLLVQFFKKPQAGIFALDDITMLSANAALPQLWRLRSRFGELQFLAGCIVLASTCEDHDLDLITFCSPLEACSQS